MTKAQHTPGKWSAQKIAMSGNYLINTTENDGNTFTIAQFTKSINMCGKRKIEHEANARLIASAPCLLQALKRWHEFAINNGYTDDDFKTESVGWISETAAAIAKATGE